VTIAGSIASATANVFLAKPPYEVPFRLYAVFAKRAKTWSLAHLHIATP
jgi:hypothetical protein